MTFYVECEVMSQPVPIFSTLEDIRGSYDFIFCDVWGVLHNGVTGFSAAVDALAQFRKDGGSVSLITNAPRPSAGIIAQLEGFGIHSEAYDVIVTSGDVTRASIRALSSPDIIHIGPDRDLPIFDGLDINRVDDETGKAIVCTGLFDDIHETVEDYRDRLKGFATRGLQFICANPDRVVQRGDLLIPCAGALADLYEELGGEIVMVGKPYHPIYDSVCEKLEQASGRKVDLSRALAVGDGFPTDITGAKNYGVDALLITAGIHGLELSQNGKLNPDLIAEKLASLDLAAVGAMEALA